MHGVQGVSTNACTSSMLVVSRNLQMLQLAASFKGTQRKLQLLTCNDCNLLF